MVQSVKEVRTDRKDLTRVSDGPHKLNNFDSALAFEVILDQVLYGGKRVSNSATTCNKDGSRKACEDSVAWASCKKSNVVSQENF